MFYLLGDVGTGASFAHILAIILGYIFAIVIAFGMHEFMHAFTAYKLGDPTPKAMGRLTINPLKHLDAFGMIAFMFIGFGWARPVEINPMNFRKYKRDMFLVSIAGVVTNLALAFVFSGAFFFFYYYVATFNEAGVLYYANELLYFVHYFLEFCVMLNIALFIFNLIPVYPLDGFNAISAIARPNNRFVNFMFRYGSLIMLLIIITPIFDILYSLVTNHIVNVFFNFWGIFVWVR